MPKTSFLPLDFRFSVSRNVRKINFCPLSHTVCGILLWQPEETNTRGNVTEYEVEKRCIELTFAIGDGDRKPLLYQAAQNLGVIVRVLEATFLHDDYGYTLGTMEW